MPKFTKEQLNAIEFDNTNILVSAGAGSGKTAVLTERIIHKLKKDIDITSFLVLTFTNAAAFSMKEKIKKKLKSESLTNQKLKNQLEIIDSAYITTFDSFCLDIVKKYHYVLNINKNINIIDSAFLNIKIDEFLNTIMDEYYENNDNDFNNLIFDFCVRDDEIITNQIKFFYKEYKKIYNIDFLKNYINDFYNDEFLNNNINDYLTLIFDKINNIKHIFSELNFITDENLIEYVNTIKTNLSGLINSTDYNNIKENLNVEYPRMPSKKSIIAYEKETVKNSISFIKNEVEEITKLCKYNNTQEIKDAIVSTKNNINKIIEIVLKLDRKINELKRYYNTYEFLDISIMAISILANNEDIRKTYKNKLNEIMIDEYQDTNDIQEYLISLISNNNVYMVGDVKQSIYKFRDANPKIFMNKYLKYKNNDNGIKIDLNKNFRSRSEVLDIINTIFENIMDLKIGGVTYDDSQQMVFGNTNYDEYKKQDQNYDFEVLNYDLKDTIFEKEYTKEEVEIFTIANDIKTKIENKYQIYDKDLNILRDAKYSDFLILIDRKKTFSLYKQIFEHFNIPLTIHSDSNFIDTNYIMVIKNYLALINSINNKEYYNEYFNKSLLSVLRSFIYDYDDNMITNLYLTSKKTKETVIDLLYKNDYFTKIVSDIEYLVKYKNYPISKILIELYDRVDILVKLTKLDDISSNIDNINHLIDISKNLETMDFNIEMFIDYLNTLYLDNKDIQISNSELNDEACNIMTIHKSKGLEANICYFSELFREFNQMEKRSEFRLSKKYGFVIPYIKEGINNTIYTDLINKENDIDNISESIRLFYVALTRAAEKIICVTNFKEEELTKKLDVSDEARLKYKSFKTMLASIMPLIYPYIKNVSLDKINLSKNYLNNMIDEDFDNSNEFFNINNKEISKKILERHISESKYVGFNKYIEIGDDIHKSFEYIDFNKDSDNKYINNFKNQELIKNLVDYKVYKEYEFIDEFDNLNRIDLMYEGINDIIIIDYKLKNTSNDKYLEQLTRYKKFIEYKYKKKVLIYLYSIINNEIINLNEKD